MNSFRRFYRRANFMAHIISTRLSGKPRPVITALAVTSRCNLRCSFCFGQYSKKDLPDLAREEIHGLIDQLARRGTRFINFTGGEPLMRRDIGSIIRRALDRGMLTALTTNGLLIDRYLDELALLDFVCVSVDGDESSHDRVRGDGTYKKAMANIRLLLERGVPVQVSCVLNRYNITNLRRLFVTGKELGFTVKLLMPTDETELAPHNPDLALTDEEMRSALARVIRWQREGFPIDFSPSTYNHALQWPRSIWQPIVFQGGPSPLQPWPCYAGKYWCHIEPDGKVYPCCYIIKDFQALDFRQAGFDEAFARTTTRVCTACIKMAGTEFNQLLDLRLRVIVGNARRSLRLFFKSPER